MPTPRDLFVRPTVALAPSEFFALWEATDDAIGDPMLPILIAQALSPESFSPPIFAALCSPDLNRAARRIQAYKPLIAPLRIHVELGDHTTTITNDWGSALAPPKSLALTELLFWVALVRLATRMPVQPARATLPDPPADPASYLDYLGIEITRGDHHAIEFTAGDAAHPFLTTNDDMWSYFEPELRRRLHELDGNATTTDRVRSALLELLPSGRTAMRDVSQELAMSTRTLQRRLAAEGTSFARVLATTRESLARHYLTVGDVTTAEISYLLGYADPSSFSRAFQDWTGTTPERIRSEISTD